jgi:hypothetical protein
VAALLASEREASSFTTYAVKNEEGQQMLILNLETGKWTGWVYLFLNS